MSAHTPGPHIPEDCHVEQCSLCAPIFEARERAKTTLPSGAPLPWKVRHCDRDGAIVEDANGLAIATVWGRAAEHASKLAAAPDLLAACERALSALNDGGAEFVEYHADDLAAIRAAIAKAVKP